ncbi:efflux RND transporter periplasmic adaptor subunit [Mahella australiensis]|uniref:Efflux transporter, RND family, MFP subunit n=1 Tax=Mahella australiensis (strain DSM 15567 / CIP 107919 / 50-1 BON) TaxID=697281 RepID=F3ZYF3_MAHA5|nr:efflux RND transporter periplasmic adaptor subunit [Mahella australiensis]AEE96695.1 efflux transporter, RND family, MFP subunit [Mahella australiensis 50-1 BON]
MKRFFATWWGKLIIVVIVVAIGFGTYYGVRAYINRNSGNVQQAGQFATVAARKGSITVSINGTGTMEPAAQEDVIIDGSGTIKKMYFKESDTVKKGDLMYEIENESLPLSIKQAELNIKQMQLSADDIEGQISKAIVTIPNAGLLDLNVSEGEQVSLNMPVATVQDISVLSLAVSVYGQQAGSIKEGQSVTITVSGVSGSFNGKVVQVTQSASSVQGGSGSGNSAPQIAVSQERDTTDTNDIEQPAQAMAVIDVTNRGSKLRISQTASAVIKTDTGNVSAFGQLSAKSSPVQIKAPISGKIQTLYVSDGVIVSKGQKLLKFDTAILQNNLDVQNTKIEQAQLDLQNQKAQLDKLKVYAPIGGVIITQNVEEGDNVNDISQASSSSSNDQQSALSSNISSPLNSSSGSVSSTSKGNVAATIADVGKFQVSIAVDELDINKIKVGQKAVITADALPDQSFVGEVIDVEDQGTSQNGVTTYDVTVAFDRVQDMKTGMTADVEIIAAQKDNIVIVPIEAVMERNGKKFVIIYDEANTTLQQNNMREVKTGINNESYIEITEGLKKGEKVMLTSAASQNSNASFPGVVPPGMGGLPGNTQRQGTSGRAGFMPQGLNR